MTISVATTGDSALFSFDATNNELSIGALDYDDPRDANRDNVYEISVSASDGTNTTTQVYTLTIADERDTFFETTGGVAFTTTDAGSYRLRAFPIADLDGDGYYEIRVSKQFVGSTLISSQIHIISGATVNLDEDGIIPFEDLATTQDAITIGDDTNTFDELLLTPLEDINGDQIIDFIGYFESDRYPSASFADNQLVMLDGKTVADIFKEGKDIAPDSFFEKTKLLTLESDYSALYILAGVLDDMTGDGAPEYALLNMTEQFRGEALDILFSEALTGLAPGATLNANTALAANQMVRIEVANPQTTDMDARISGLGDFNGDRIPDILVQLYENGIVANFTTKLLSGAALPPLAGQTLTFDSPAITNGAITFEPTPFIRTNLPLTAYPVGDLNNDSFGDIAFYHIDNFDFANPLDNGQEDPDGYVTEVVVFGGQISAGAYHISDFILADRAAIIHAETTMLYGATADHDNSIPSTSQRSPLINFMGRFAPAAFNRDFNDDDYPELTTYSVAADGNTVVDSGATSISFGAPAISPGDVFQIGVTNPTDKTVNIFGIDQYNRLLMYPVRDTDADGIPDLTGQNLLFHSSTFINRNIDLTSIDQRPEAYLISGHLVAQALENGTEINLADLFPSLDGPDDARTLEPGTAQPTGPYTRSVGKVPFEPGTNIQSRPPLVLGGVDERALFAIDEVQVRGQEQ